MSIFLHSHEPFFFFLWHRREEFVGPVDHLLSLPFGTTHMKPNLRGLLQFYFPSADVGGNVHFLRQTPINQPLLLDRETIGVFKDGKAPGWNVYTKFAHASTKAKDNISQESVQRDASQAKLHPPRKQVGVAAMVNARKDPILFGSYWPISLLTRETKYLRRSSSLRF